MQVGMRAVILLHKILDSGTCNCRSREQTGLSIIREGFLLVLHGPNEENRNIYKTKPPLIAMSGYKC